MRPELSRSGIEVVGEIPWGVHFSLFYETPTDLLDAVVPYFAAGLDAGELCLWGPTESSIEQAAFDALRNRVPDFDGHLRRGDIQVFRYEDLFLSEGVLDVAGALSEYKKWEHRARTEGYAGLRASGNLSWIDRASWPTFAEYEKTLHEWVTDRRMLVLCSYPLSHLEPTDIFDLAQAHHFVIARRKGDWEVLETPELKRTKDELRRLNDELEQRVAERTSELGMANDELQAEIEERQRVEADLRRSETYLEHGQQLGHTGSYAMDPRTREFTYWSAETFRIFGLEPRVRPPARRETYELIHPADRERIHWVSTDVIMQERDAELDFRVIRPGRNVRYVHAVARPVFDETGRLVEVVGSLIDVTERKRATARLAKVKRLARERTLEQRFAATLEERTRLAREIHDSLLQGVTGIALQLRATLPNLGDAPRATVQSIRDIVELAESTIRDARRVVWDIRSPALTQKGLSVALEHELRRIASDIQLTYTVEGAPRPLSPPIEDTIFRIGQEAVMNAARHSSAESVTAVLEYRPRSVRLTIVDDGRGFRVDPKNRTHGGRWGLLGMRERAERIGASLVIRSEPGSGTAVELSVRSQRTPAAKKEQAPGSLTRAS